MKLVPISPAAALAAAVAALKKSGHEGLAHHLESGEFDPGSVCSMVPPGPVQVAVAVLVVARGGNPYGDEPPWPPPPGTIVASRRE